MEKEEYMTREERARAREIEESFKDCLEEYIGTRDSLLVRIFRKHRNGFEIGYFENGSNHSDNSYFGISGNMFYNINDIETTDDVFEAILIFFREIGRKLDKKSSSFNESEFRAKRFEYKVARRLGEPFFSMACLNDFTRTAGENDYHLFNQLLANPFSRENFLSEEWN